MTQEDIIRMAREAGLASIYSACDEPGVRYAYEDWDEELERFAALSAALAQPDKCEWAQEDESSDAWDTGCGRTFLINDGTPPENGMCYCCFCGKTLIGVPFEQENSGNE
jgi:hypothetical protein